MRLRVCTLRGATGAGAGAGRGGRCGGSVCVWLQGALYTFPKFQHLPILDVHQVQLELGQEGLSPRAFSASLSSWLPCTGALRRAERNYLQALETVVQVIRLFLPLCAIEFVQLLKSILNLILQLLHLFVGILDLQLVVRHGASVNLPAGQLSFSLSQTRFVLRAIAENWLYGGST